MSQLAAVQSGILNIIAIFFALFVGGIAYGESQMGAAKTNVRASDLAQTNVRASDLAKASVQATEVSAPGLAKVVDGVSTAPIKKEILPYRTFITIQRYNMEQSGDTKNQISNIRIKITFPNGSKVELPGGGQYWPIGNGQVQEINRTFEIPFSVVQNDGFKFQIQMERKGDEFLPCQFDVIQLSEFNRSYVCHTDLGWQTQQRIAEEKQDKEGIQVRVFTDLNSKPNEIPRDSLALK